MNSQAFIELWKSAAGGDRESLQTLLRELQDLIFRYCRSQLGSDDFAVECTQETAVRLIQNLASFGGQSQPTTWVLGIANNVCREFRRKNNNRPLTSDMPLDGLIEHRDPTSGVVTQEIRQQISAAIGSLSDRQREAVVLRYFEDLSIKQVADVMKVATGTVKATIKTALDKMKIMLGDSC